jgi:A/G-specific adenine glycosylase
MEATIELGALICKKEPLCFKCPLMKDCKGFSEGKVKQLPIKNKKISYESLRRVVYVCQVGDFVYLKQGSSGKIMEGLFEFPYQEIQEKDVINSEVFAKKWIEKNALNQKVYSSSLQIQKHTFTRFRVQLFPYWILLEKRPSFEGGSWISIKELKKLAFSSGHRRILKECLPFFKQIMSNEEHLCKL